MAWAAETGQGHAWQVQPLKGSDFPRAVVKHDRASITRASTSTWPGRQRRGEGDGRVHQEVRPLGIPTGYFGVGFGALDKLWHAPWVKGRARGGCTQVERGVTSQRSKSK